jgi:23S rRNA (cytosine1962-C5)-methyltransferase
MTAPFRKPPAAPPFWVTEKIWKEIEATGTDTFLAAWSPSLRLERWGTTLRALATQPHPPSCDELLLKPPPGFPWKADRVLWQMEGERTAQHLSGEGWTSEVQELGLHYGIDLTPGTAPGLFPDQRENRALLRSRRPVSLLNLFAHTCAFGVLAGSVGATTLNIDTSARALERGRENFRRNQLEEKDHRFWKEDVRKALPRLHRRGETFDAIILDPPTFAHGGRGRAFRIEKEIEPMLTACLQLLRPAGVLLVSINESHTALGDLERQIHPLLHRAKIPARLEPSRRPPEVPAVRMPAGVWLFRED